MNKGLKDDTKEREREREKKENSYGKEKNKI